MIKFSESVLFIFLYNIQNASYGALKIAVLNFVYRTRVNLYTFEKALHQKVEWNKFYRELGPDLRPYNYNRPHGLHVEIEANRNGCAAVPRVKTATDNIIIVWHNTKLDAIL